MHPCRFQAGPLKFNKNNVQDLKCQKSSFSFTQNGVNFRSVSDNDKSNYRVTLRHKVTGDIKHFNTKWLSFKPDIQKLNSNGSSIDNTIAELLQQESPKAVFSTPTKALDTKTDLLNLSTNNIDGERRIQLSTIAPAEVLDSLKVSAKNLVSKTAAELVEMVNSHWLHKSVLSLVKRQATSDIKKIQLCLLLDHMITFYMLPINNIRKKSLDNCPPTVFKFLIQSYTVEDLTEKKKMRIQVPKSQKEKLMETIICLYSYLSNFHFTLDLLRADLKCSTDKLKKRLETFDIKVARASKNVGDDATTKDLIASANTPFVLE